MGERRRWYKPVNVAVALALVAALSSVLLLVTTPVAASPDGLTFYSGFEFGDFTEEWSQASGSVSVQSTIKKTGDYAMRCNPSASFGFIIKNVSGNTYRLSFYLYIATAPNTDRHIAGNYGGVAVILSSDRFLKLYDGGLEDTGTTQLNTSKWYRISLSLDAANNAAKVYLDGVEECSSTTVTGSALGHWLGSPDTVTFELYFDNYVIDDVESTSDIGDIRVVRSQPNAMGTYTGQWQQFPASTNHYEKIDECPADDTYYTWAEATGAQLDESYGLEDCSALGLAANDTVNAVSIWWRYTTDGGGDGEYASMVRDDGTDYYDWTIYDIKDPTWLNRYYATMPNGGAAWTQARFNAFEVGMATKDAGKDMWLYCVMVMVAYMTPTWESYESDYSTIDDLYDTGGDIIYMKGAGFAAGSYIVRYYDADGTQVGTDANITVPMIGEPAGVLKSNLACNTNEGATAGTWNAKAYLSDGTTLIADDTFTVTSAAIPEFPTAITALVVAGLCFGIYYWMRRRLGYARA